METTTVIFRRWPNGDIIALFPEINADYEGRYCQCYAHVGQHGGADYRGVVQRTKPATLKEYGALAKELRGLGYKLRVRRKWSKQSKERNP